MKTFVFSLGGSLIAPDGIDAKFLAGFRRVILRFVARGNRAIIICGGGNTARQYIHAVRRLNPRAPAVVLDWIGIEATKLNAWLVRDVFGGSAEQQLLYNPTKKIVTRKRIIIGSGWKPGCSTDKDAVLAAKTYGIHTIVNLSNIAYVYDRDPGRFKRAKPLRELRWPEFLKIVGSNWRPGAHTPFDPVASRLAERWGIRLVVMRGSDMTNVQNFLTGAKFRGTTVWV